MKREVAIIIIGLLAVVAVVGWTRTPQGLANTATAAAPVQPAAYAQPQFAYGQPYAVPPGVSPALYVAPQAVSPVPQPGYVQPAPGAHVRRAVVRQSYEPVRTSEVKRGRPLSHSVAIVAGSSGAGAAIGALAGGGKGAAIGALAGGAGGFIYDRLTHNR